MLLTFILDYYVSGSSLQGFALPKESFAWFLALFGNKPDNVVFTPLLGIDLTIMAIELGVVIFDLIVIISVVADSGLSLRAPKPVEYVKHEYREYRRLNIVEYISWWVTWIMMVCVVVYNLRRGRGSDGMLVLYVNLVMTFIVPIFRALFFFLEDAYKLPLRVQSFLNVFIIGGSFFGQGLEFNSRIDDFDKYLHFISGCIVVWVGYVVLRQLEKEESRLSNRQIIICAGLSAQVMVVWEFFEFLADAIMIDSYCQNPGYVPKDDSLFLRIFGPGAMNPGQSAVLDTNLDILYAVTGCLLGILVLIIYKRGVRHDAVDNTAGVGL